MTNPAKYHPTKACVKCGRVRRVMCRGMCYTCYADQRELEQPGLRAKRREACKQYMKTYDRADEKYVSPMTAIHILVEAFEREGVNIDDVCAYIAMTRQLYCKDTTVANKTTHRHWTRRKHAVNHRSNPSEDHVAQDSEQEHA